MTDSTTLKNISLSLATSTLALIPSSTFAQGQETPLAIITVDQRTDADGDCSTAGTCNLRAAIAKALTIGGKVQIDLNVDSEISAGEISIAVPADSKGPLNLAIIGEGEKNILGNASSKLFSIDSGINVTLSDLNISNFQAYNSGVISNAGTLTLAQTQIRGNKAKCSGNGAMTAFATCWAGAVENTGSLILKDGVKFQDNIVEATASAASFTNANASGGAIVSSGSITFDGEVTFRNNLAIANATSGFHGQMPGGSSATAAGGAISNSGTISITENGIGKCEFQGNEARTVSYTVKGEAIQNSSGGAIATQALEGVNLIQSCIFEGNAAATDSDFFVYPAS